MGWKKVKARKEYQCHCCCGAIPKDTEHFVETIWKESQRFPQITRYCLGCGEGVKEGLSFRQARIKAFGSPFLRGWIYPKTEELSKTKQPKARDKK